ncbi:MAG: hypothetical protein M3314_08890 [Actinomycetota bacterium]|nr:hypothetical protein [Actinomycetota bacterium]
MHRFPVVAAVVVGLALAGCSSDGGDGAEVVRNAPDRTIDAGSARTTVSLSFTSSGNPTTIRGEGVFDLRNRIGGLTVDLGALGAGFGGAPVDAVIAPEGLFVKLPPGQNTGGRPWLKLDLATLSQQAGLNVGSLAQLQQSDPTQALTYLKGALDDVEEVDEETQRGEETTHYRGTIDLRKASASLPPDAQRGVEDAIASLGTSRLPVDVWVDDEGRIRRMIFSADPDGAGPNQPGRVDIELYDFGATADVQVPPADQVTDLTNLFATTPR